MPSIPCVLKAKLPHHKEGGFLIKFSFSLLICCCKPMSFSYVKGNHLPCIHMGPLFPLTTTKEKHFIVLAVLESWDLLFAFTSGRAVAGQGLLQWHPGDGHQGTQLTVCHCIHCVLLPQEHGQDGECPKFGIFPGLAWFGAS